MAQINTTQSAMMSAASQMETAIASFENATNAASNTALTLAATWEGVSKDKFLDHQSKQAQWFTKMAEICHEWSAFLQKEAPKYGSKDQDMANVIKI